MKIAICCDVDPVLPTILSRGQGMGVWHCLGQIENLCKILGNRMPPITWLIRSDESVRFATGEYASGFMVKKQLWLQLQAEGHELGWHMHTLSQDHRAGCFEFDPEPTWLEDAFRAIFAEFPVTSARTGWYYGSNSLMLRLDSLGVRVDLSALPGNLIWQRVGNGSICIDWRRCQPVPYHPSLDDYQMPGQEPLQILEVRVYQFNDRVVGIVKRYLWRLLHGVSSPVGISAKTRALTQEWPGAPVDLRGMAALFFHPYDLDGRGIDRLVCNLSDLRRLPEVEFVTASELPSIFSLPKARCL